MKETFWTMKILTNIMKNRLISRSSSFSFYYCLLLVLVVSLVACFFCLSSTNGNMAAVDNTPASFAAFLF